MSRPPADLRPSHVPVVLDATVLAHGHLTWEHEFRDVAFPRLKGLVLSDQPVVTIQLQFALHEQRPVVDAVLRAELELICQRCLKPMRHPVNEQFDLMLVNSESEVGLVAEPYEPWVTHAARADVFELVDEQLLLALPLIAKHVDVTECQRNVPGLVLLDDGPVEHSESSMAVGDVSEKAVQRPFGNLSDLMRKR